MRTQPAPAQGSHSDPEKEQSVAFHRGRAQDKETVGTSPATKYSLGDTWELLVISHYQCFLLVVIFILFIYFSPWYWDGT